MADEINNNINIKKVSPYSRMVQQFQSSAEQLLRSGSTSALSSESEKKNLAPENYLNAEDFVRKNQGLLYAISQDSESLSQLESQNFHDRSDLLRMIGEIAYRQVKSVKDQSVLPSTLRQFPMIAAFYLMNHQNIENMFGQNLDWVDLFMSYMSSSDSPFLNEDQFPVKNTALNSEILEFKEELIQLKSRVQHFEKMQTLDSRSKSKLDQYFKNPKIIEQLAYFFKQKPISEQLSKQFESYIKDHFSQSSEDLNILSISA